MAQGKKRAGNEKAKLKRARSYAKNQVAKQARKDEQAKREAHNRAVGTTGKQRANLAAKEAKRRQEVVKEIASGYKAKVGREE